MTTKNTPPSQPTQSVYIVAKDDVTLPVDGSANKREPEPIFGTQGWDEGLPFDCSTINYIFNNLGKWVKYLHESAEYHYVDLKNYIDEKHRLALQAVSDLGTSVNKTISDLQKTLTDQITAIKETTLTAGDGLDGGGNLTGDRTFSVDNTVVRTEGTQSLNGQKTFTSIPHVSVSQTSAGNGLVRKDYVDGKFRSSSATFFNTPTVVMEYGAVGASKDIDVPSSVPEGAICLVNFRARTDNEQPESYGLIASGGTANISSADQANIFAMYWDSGSRTFASSGQVLAKKVGGKIRISKTGGTLNASLSIAGFIPQE